MALSVGQIVFSKSGRDKGKPFVIYSLSGEYAFLIDGDLRKISNPKKKKIKHIQITNTVISDLSNKIESKDVGFKDSDVRNALKQSGFKSLSDKERDIFG